MKRFIGKVPLLFGVVIFLPSFYFVVGDSSSMAVGLLSSCVLIFFLSGLKLSVSLTKNLFASVLTVLIIIHMTLGFFLADSVKQIFSFFLLLLLLFSGAVLEFQLYKERDENVLNQLKKLTISFLFIGLLSLIIDYEFIGLGYQNFTKPVFPFAEPSHFVLGTSSIFLLTGFFFSTGLRNAILVTLTVYAVLYPNLIMLLLVFLMGTIYYSNNLLRLFFVLIPVVTILSFLWISEDVQTYFVDRLSFNQTTTNLSVLIYLQGWEEAYKALIETSGFGLGFQNLGTQPPGKFGEMVHSLTGRYLNRADGSFLAAKLISEFGVLGLILVLVFLTSFFRSLRFLISFQRKIDSGFDFGFDLRYVFAHSIVVSFFIEMFVRGYGYFSPGVLFLFTAFFVLQTPKKRNNYN